MRKNKSGRPLAALELSGLERTNKRVLQASAIGLGIALSFSCLAADASKHLYLGVDQQIRHLVFENNYGGNLLSKNYRQNNLFVGVKFNEYFGLETGYQWTDRRNNWGRVGRGELIYGNPTALNITDSVNNLKSCGSYVDFVSSYAVKTPSEQQIVFALGVGIGNQKIGVQHYITGDSAATTPNLSTTSRNFKFRKTVLRVSPSVQYFLSERWGIRAKFIYENLSGSKNFSAASDSPLTFTAKIKNSFSYGLGIFWQY